MQKHGKKHIQYHREYQSQTYGHNPSLLPQVTYDTQKKEKGTGNKTKKPHARYIQCCCQNHDQGWLTLELFLFVFRFPQTLSYN